MKLYLFNPDTDLALSDNNENYMAPASARVMAHDLALLPMWYAQPGSAVLAPSAYNAAFLEQMRQLFPLEVRLATEPELPDYAEAEVIPWGWNPAVRKYLLRGGIAEDRLPSSSDLQVYRELSSRKKALEVLKTFEGVDTCCGGGDYLSEVDACKAKVDRCTDYVFKAPWSGSGKGLLWCYGNFSKAAANWCGHVLKEQGYLIGSAVYNKVEDFAMEFYSTGEGTVCFTGYSLFATNKKGAYLGNRLLPSEAIEKKLAEYVPLSVLSHVCELLQDRLSRLCGNLYIGYLGVDMMICRSGERDKYGEEDKYSEGDKSGEGDKYVVHPCVEINLRMNMGMASRLFCDRFMDAGSSGYFCIEYNPSNEELQGKHKEDIENFPLKVENGRLVSGYLPLVPVTPKSLYRAYVVIR